MDLFAAWLLYPVALALLCLGLALLVERVAGWRLPGLLLLPVGFAALLTLAQLITARGDTARLALPLIGLLALAGIASGHRRVRALRPDPWLVGVAVAVFAVFAAPILASGTPTFAGYLALPDTGHQLALAELYAHHGPDWFALDDSATREGVTPYVISGYPIAGQATLGVTAPLGGGLDVAWLYQPLLTFAALITGLALASIARPLFAQRWRVALVAFVAAQPALLIGFALQGSIKELTGVAVLLTVIAVVTAALRERRPARSLLVLAPAVGAALGTIGVAAAVYLALPAVVAAAVWGTRAVRAGRGRELAWIAVTAAVAVGLAWPALRMLETQFTVQSGTLDDGASPAFRADLGNLAAPLDTAQALGVWLVGDYRYRTLTSGTLQDVELWLAGALAVLGLAWAVRRRAWGPLLLFAATALPSVYLLQRGNSYADAKVLTLASPAILLLVILGAASLWKGRWRALSALAMAGVLVAVGWSSALAYHDVSLAPYDRLQEMRQLGERLDGRGPVLVGEYDEHGKHFLSGVPPYIEPETNHDYRPGRFGDRRRRPSVKTPLDLDDLELDYVEKVPYIILRRGPMASRPPANFRRVWTGNYYELWQRTREPRVLRHEPLGRDILTPAGTVSEARARSVARRARRRGARIAFTERARPPIFYVSRVPRPQRWGGFGDFPDALVSDGPGRVDAPVTVPRAGDYHVWIEGSFARRLTIRVDGKVVGHTPFGLDNPGAYASIGSVRLSRGKHGVQVTQGGGDLRPSNGGYRSSLRHIGPIVFEPAQHRRSPRVTSIAPRDWRRLVGVRSDWLEIIKP
jgi:hypothetical protein